MKHLFVLIFACCLCFYFLSAQNDCEGGLFDCNLYVDDEHAPFIYGVGSFDPTFESIIIWTQVSATETLNEATVFWELAADENFEIILAAGTQAISETTDFTAKVQIDNLKDNTRYFYRFYDEAGNYSVIGKTKTFPKGSTEHLRFATMSCSSLFSGYFNAYRKVAESEAFDAVIHLGDYIYDFVDADEEVRVPEPYPQVPQSLEEWRERHKLYLMDPDLRAMRQNHPMIAIWDNHDITEPGNPEQSAASIQAFQEYLPVRLQHNEDENKIYRKIEVGNLLDLIMVDITNLRDIDEVISGAPSILGAEQSEWLFDTFENSQSTWRLIGNQKMMGGWYAEGLGIPLPIETDGPVFDANSWDGYIQERRQLFEFLQEKEINNNVVVSGDIHMSFVMDLAVDPRDSLLYDPETGLGCVGGEFIASSITRGNIDEETGIPAELNNGLASVIMPLNPHHVHNEFFSHGYGVVDIKPDSLVVEFWYCPKLEISDEKTFAGAYVMYNGANRWNRDTLLTPTAETLDYNIITSVNEPIQLDSKISLSPNPSNEFTILNTDRAGLLSIYSIDGKLVYQQSILVGETRIETQNWQQGHYLFKFQEQGSDRTEKLKFIKH